MYNYYVRKGGALIRAGELEASCKLEASWKLEAASWKAASKLEALASWKATRRAATSCAASWEGCQTFDFFKNLK